METLERFQWRRSSVYIDYVVYIVYSDFKLSITIAKLLIQNLF